MKILVAVSCALVAATFLVHLGAQPSWVFAHLALTNENNAAAWWSGMLLALISLNAYDGYALLRRDAPRAAHGWVILAPVFLFLSFSEVGSIHERIANAGRELSIGAWPPIIVLGAIIASACARSLVLLWSCPAARRAVPWLIVGFFLFGLAAVEEYLEFKLTLESRWALATRAALEEGTELLAMLVILRVTSPNSARLSREHRFAALYELRTPLLLVGAMLAPVLAVGTSMLTDYHRGQPADWIAMIAFLAAGASLWNRNWSLGAAFHLAGSIVVVEAAGGSALTHCAIQAFALGAYWMATLHLAKEKGMLTEQEWQQAEQREPDRVYLEPDYRRSKRLETAAYAIFFVGALTIAGFAYSSLPAFAEGGWSSSDLSDPAGDRGGGGICCSESPHKTEGSSRRGNDPFNEPDISRPGDGMTSGDAYY